jgi:hypothetical protein
MGLINLGCDVLNGITQCKDGFAPIIHQTIIF